MKTCIKCEVEKENSVFPRGGHKCKVCLNVERKIRDKKLMELYKLKTGTKKCNTCNIDKDIQLYEYTSSKCKDCRNIRKRERNRNEIKKRHAEFTPDNVEMYRTKATKICAKCDNTYCITKFIHNRSTCKYCDTGIVYDSECSKKYCKYCAIDQPENEFRKNRLKCKDCERVAGVIDGKTDQRKQEKSDWATNNKPQMGILQNSSYEKNKLKIRAKNSAKYHDINSNFKIIKTYRIALATILSGRNNSSSALNFSRDTLVKWVSHQFDDEMTFENYGTNWTIDHVIPLKTIDEHPELQDMIFEWTNLMPVNKKYNMTKKAIIDIQQIEKHRKTLKTYLKENKLKNDDNKKYMKYLKNIINQPN
jgi:hypothetical protein